MTLNYLRRMKEAFVSQYETIKLDDKETPLYMVYSSEVLEKFIKYVEERGEK